jgi:glycosyltransferase involved in cell wall biosynthesis
LSSGERHRVNDTPLVAVIGTTDVDKRIDLMCALQPDFRAIAMGTSADLGAVFDRQGLPYVSYTLSGPMDIPLAIAQLTRHLRDIKPDIVHTFDTVPSIAGRLAARRAHVPVVVGTLPGLGRLYTGRETFVKTTVRAAYEAVQRRVSQMSALTIFQHEDDRDCFVRRRIVRSERTDIVAGSGIRTDQFRRDLVPAAVREATRREFGAPPDALVVVMVADLMRSKGVVEFGQAAAALASRFPHTRFVLAGSPSAWRKDYLTPDETRRLAGAVHCLGRRDDIAAILASSDVFVLPSSYAEGIPRALLEAASMELAIVTSDSPGCRAVVRDGMEGLLVPPRDAAALTNAIERMIREPEVRVRCGQAARTRAEHEFDLRVVTARTKAIYRGLLAAGGQGRGK